MWYGTVPSQEDGRYGQGDYSVLYYEAEEYLSLLYILLLSDATRRAPHQPLRLVLGPLRAEELPPLPSPID